MKKNTFAFIAFFIAFCSYAQFEVKKIDGTNFTNGEVIDFTTHSTSAAELKFTVHNNATENLDFRIRCMELINADGSNFQLCWGYECIPSVSQNGIYPDYQNVINAGASTVGLGDSFKNFNGGDGVNYPAEYSFRIFTKDLNGTNVGSSFNIKYRYQGPLSIEQRDKLSSMGIKVLNTQVDNFIGLEISKEVNYELINIQGQIISNGMINQNTNIDMASTSAGIYILNFTTSEGLTDSIKIYKK